MFVDDIFTIDFMSTDTDYEFMNVYYIRLH